MDEHIAKNKKRKEEWKFRGILKDGARETDKIKRDGLVYAVIELVKKYEFKGKFDHTQEKKKKVPICTVEYIFDEETKKYVVGYHFTVEQRERFGEECRKEREAKKEAGRLERKGRRR